MALPSLTWQQQAMVSSLSEVRADVHCHLFTLVVLEIETMALFMLGKCSTTELHLPA